MVRVSLRRERLWTRQTWPFITSVLALMTCNAFESFAVTTILPVAVTDLGSTSWYSFAYSATITTALIGMVVGGNWSDQSGPRTPLIVGGTAFLAGLLLNIIAIDVTTFIVGRIMQGLGGGINSVVLYVLISRHIPERSRPRMFGLLTTAWLFPSLAGPLAAGALAELTSWRTVFGIVGVGAAASLLCLLHSTRTSQSELVASNQPIQRPARRGIGRNGTLAVLAAGLLAVLHLAGQMKTPISVIVVIGASVTLMIAARSILPKGTLTLRGTPQRLIVLRATLGATVTSADLYLTLYLQSERVYSPTAAGLVIAIGAGGWALGALVQGRFPSNQFSNHRLILIATVLVCAGPATILIYTITDVQLWVVVIACVLMGTGMGMAYPRVSSATLALTDAEEQGAYSSALQAGESMGIGVVTAVIATILASGGSFATTYVLLLGLAVAASVVASISVNGGTAGSS